MEGGTSGEVTCGMIVTFFRLIGCVNGILSDFMFLLFFLFPGATPFSGVFLWKKKKKTRFEYLTFFLNFYNV